MSLPAEHLATYEDLLTVPDHMIAEIIDGALITHPRPAPKHTWVASRMGGELDPPFNTGRGGPGGWIILDEPEVHLGSNILVPDLAGWRRERMPTLAETAWFEVAPDWICEVLSSSTAKTDRIEKMPIYATAGVQHLWLIDPEIQTIEVYVRQEDEHWLLLSALSNDDEVRQPPFDAISFDLSALWP